MSSVRRARERIGNNDLRYQGNSHVAWRTTGAALVVILLHVPRLTKTSTGNRITNKAAMTKATGADTHGFRSGGIASGF